MRDVNSYCLDQSIGQIIMPKDDDENLKHPAIYTTKVDFADHHQYFINDGLV